MKRLDTLLQQQDASSSVVKDSVSAAGASMAAMVHSMANDEVLRKTVSRAMHSMITARTAKPTSTKRFDIVNIEKLSA